MIFFITFLSPFAQAAQTLPVPVIVPSIPAIVKVVFFVVVFNGIVRVAAA